MKIDFDNVKPLGSSAKAFLRNEKKLLIGGHWVTGNGHETFDSIDPSTGKLITKFPCADKADVDAAVGAARKALQGKWSSMTPNERGKILWKMAELIEANIEELAQLETLDQGKPLYVGLYGEIPGAAEQFRFYAGEATKIEGSTIPSSINYQPEGKRIFAYTKKEPIGVVAAIVPWNSPIVLTAMKLAPALAAGCTVVLKPAEDTSLTALRLGELLIEAGLPNGVVNIVTGYGAKTGNLLASHMDVDKVAFTGSTTTGRAIIEAAKSNLKKVSLELGGKSPVIILADADIDAATTGAANSIFYNGGQVCIAGSRLYVHRDVYDDVVTGLVKIAKSLTIKPGLAPDCEMGPLVNKTQVEKVLGFIDRAKLDGAIVECGGKRVGDVGCYVEPTVISHVSSEMEIVREEIFGPVVVCTPIDSLEEVTELANDSDFALAASIWTNDLSTAHRLASDVKAGMVWINCHAMYDAGLPIGGMKQSGWGRDSGRQAVENYLEVKTVCAVI